MKYLRYFETEADRTKASDNGEFVKPHVSYTNETKRVDFIGKNSVSITMKSTADTTVDVFYTVDDFKALKGNETITLKANESKTAVIERPWIFSPGVVKYDYSTGKGASANTAVTEITIDGPITECRMLCSLTKLKTVDFSKMDTSKVTDMESMFDSCDGLTTLDVSSFNTSNVTNMENMFYYCSFLTSLDLSNFNTSNVTDMKRMFYGCSGLTTLDVSNFDTSNLTNMDYMFYLCKSLTSLNLGTFDTRKVISRTDMFNEINPKVEITLAADSPSLTNIQTQLITDGVTGAKIHFNGKTYYYDTTTTSWKGITSGK